MPTVRWGIDRSVVDQFDRESQFKPYDGPQPPNAVYRFQIKNLKHVAGTRDKNPQLRVGLELIPRNNDEKRYAGFFVMCFLPITDKTAFRYVPLLDALGVSATDFTDRTRTDEEGNIKRIGRWANDGEQTVKALIEDSTYEGKTRKDVNTFLEDTESEDDEYGEDDDDEEIEEEEYADDDDGEEYADEEYDEEEPEPEPAPRRRKAAPAAARARMARRNSGEPF